MVFQSSSNQSQAATSPELLNGSASSPMTNVTRHLVNVSAVFKPFPASDVLTCTFPHVFILSHYLQHLLTFSLQNGEVQSVEEAQNRLSFLAQNKKLWSQQMLLDVGAGSIHLRDIQSQDELESYTFRSIYRCEAINTEKHFPSLLMLVCQSADQKKPDIHFFNCETVKLQETAEAAVMLSQKKKKKKKSKKQSAEGDA
uniref:EPS8 signaling adaptor L1b n=1 Tax=Amphilophus citrinellus TaxID=61819 RepID=A0A3Q0QQB2_AMPCI